MLNTIHHDNAKLIAQITEPVVSSGLARFLGERLNALPSCRHIELQLNDVVYLSENALWELTDWLKTLPIETHVLCSGCNYHIMDQLAKNGMHQLVDLMEIKTA